jgi:integrase
MFGGPSCQPQASLGAAKKSDYLRAKDRDNRVTVFHSLRHGFITYLVTANVPPKVAQTLARHSTITLTMDRYTHLGVIDRNWKAALWKEAECQSRVR